MHDIAARLEDAKARWMTGGSAEAACPGDWQGALGETPELSLLVLAGQFTQLGTRPVPGGPLEERPPLPQLRLPSLPDRLRPEVRRLLASRSVPDGDVVRLIAARGHVVSPIDWMPNANDSGLPEVYAAWLDWLAQTPERDADVPTAKTWDQFSPQARLAYLEHLRKTDPDAGRALVEAVSPTLAAEPRRRVAAALAIGLSDADALFLASLQSDKSGRVQTLATNLLARLGLATADAEAVRELADFFEKTKAGILSRRTIVTARKLKSPAQRRRRAALAELVPLSALAGGLGLSAAELIGSWDFGEGTIEFCAMVVATGSDLDVLTFLERMIEAEGAGSAIEPMLDRLSAERRQALAPRILSRDTMTFEATARLLSETPGMLDLTTIRGATAFREFETAVSEDMDTLVRTVDTGFANLGLLATREAARALLDHFTRGGLMSADPRLAMLRLNAEL